MKRLIILILLINSMFMSGCMSSSVAVSDIPLEENGGVPVNVQDQTTRPFDIKVNQILNTNFSLSIVPIVNNYDLVLTDASSLSVGDNIAFLEQNGMPQLYFGTILNINVNTITLDSPIPYNFTPSNTTIFTFNNNIAIDGSTTIQTFSITNFFDESIDIVRFNFKCNDNVEMHDGLFCGEPELGRGILLRKKLLNGNYINYWNIKTNGQWIELAFDNSYTDKGKPPDDTYGFASRLTYGGQSKHGVVIRLNPGESIELLIQDDLTDISSASLIVEGHFVQN